MSQLEVTSGLRIGYQTRLCRDFYPSVTLACCSAPMTAVYVQSDVLEGSGNGGDAAIRTLHWSRELAEGVEEWTCHLSCLMLSYGCWLLSHLLPLL